MDNILIVQINSRKIQDFSFKLESILPVKVTFSSSFVECSGRVKKDEFKVIVIDFESYKTSREDLLAFLNDKKGKEKTNYFMFGIKKSFDDKTINSIDKDVLNSMVIVDGSEDFSAIIAAIKDKLQIEDSEFFNENYVRISIDHFLTLDQVECDLFIKFSQNKYLKIVKKNTPQINELARKYKEKKCHYFHILQADYNDFLNLQIKMVNSSFINPSFFNMKTRQINEIQAQKIFREFALSLGLNEFVVDLATKSINSTLFTIKKNKRLSNLLQDFNKKEDYLNDHSLLICYVAAGIFNNIDYPFPIFSLDNFCYAAFVHDISLNDAGPEISYSSNRDNFMTLNQSKTDFQRFMNHPAEAVRTISKIENISPTILQIIEQHHESPDGSGFPRGMDYQRINPLAAVLIVAEDFIQRIYFRKFDQSNINKIISGLKNKYGQGIFLKIFHALEKSFSKEN